MGKRSSRKKNAAMLDSDDTDSLSSSTSSMRLDNMADSVIEEVEVDKDTLLDQCLDALYEKRGSTREKALASIIETFNSSLQHEFVEKKYVTLLRQCLNSIKKGSAREVALASHVIGLLALTTGPGKKAQEILEESVSPISDALRTRPETSKISSLLECLAIITFVGGEEPEQTEKSMQIMWQVAHPKLGPNVATAKPSPAMITMVVSAWSFLLTTVDGWALNPKSWQESVSYFATLLDKDDRLLRIAAGEALALIFEIWSLEKFCGESKVLDSSTDEGNDSRKLLHIHGLRNKVLKQVRSLSTEAGGKGSAKKDLNSQRNTFRDILDFLEDGYAPENSMKIGGESLNTSTWAQMIQLNFLKHFLGGGFVKHMQENEFLHDVFGFIPKKKLLSGIEHRMSGSEKRMYKSPNSALNKARTQLLNKQRMLAQDKNAGHFAVGFADG
ncbi:Interferon-related protein PC4 like [Handroanthus impetiginosus]|uniref:Interferon-related protein PC4 like n=1 Tax=Handroanthus impetiginosus TaxID=429701 RepID=A0A2G9HTG9_9LAMI|nr:Interferon-related protein PC4 like [Handroanthus impetiginosus]